jgi:signal transduction histidine kinase
MTSAGRLTPTAWLLINTIAAVIAFMGATVYVSHLAKSIDTKAQDIAGNVDPSIRHLASARTELHDTAAVLTASVLDGAHTDLVQHDLQLYEGRMHRDLEAFTALPFFPTERARWEAANLDLREAEAEAEATVAAAVAGDRSRAAELRTGPAATAIARADVALEELIAFNADQASSLGTQIAQARRHAAVVAYVLDGVAGVLAFGMLAAAAQATRQHAAAVRREIRAREDVLSVVSHDLRNPLSAITLATRSLQRVVGPEDGARKQVDLLARNAKRMDRLIGDLLTAAKVQEGKLSIEPNAQDASELVAEAMDELASKAAASGLHLRAEVADGTPPVFCDAGRIVQVLSNLLGNAVKFTPPEGTIVVSARPGEAGEVRFSVRDTGPGISRDAAAHVFDRYWQKKEYASRGTGLGLFIAKGIVESHQGRIWVTSRVGQGSDFQFTLPAAH